MRTLAAVLLGWMCVCPFAGAGETELLKATLVVVNGKRVTQDHVNQMAEVMLRRRHGDISRLRMSMEEQQEVFDAALRELIRMELIFGHATKLGLSVPDERVQATLKHLGLGDPIMPKAARRYAEADVLLDKVLMAQGFGPYKPSPKQIRDLYAAEKETTFKTNSFVRVRHIILPTYGAEKPATVAAKAGLLRDRIMKKPVAERGAFFGEVAREFSDGRFADGGGLLRLGTNRQGWFPQEFGNKRPDGRAVFPVRLYKGIQAFTVSDKHKVSKVIRSDQGYHLLYLEDIKGGDYIPWARAQKLIETHLQQRERQRRMLGWLKEKLRTSQIHWNDGQRVEHERILPSDKLKEYQIK